MKKFYITARDKQLLRALMIGTGIILFWRGLWGIADGTPILENFFVSLFVGILILLFSGVIFEEFGAKENIYVATKYIRGLLRKHPKKSHKDFVVHFHDKIHKKIRKFKLHEIENIEKDAIIIKFKKREYFIPGHRIKKIVKGNEVLWEK
ncbi:MAG: RNA repair domain-containing protein [Nanoarchaeota archaeon]|nr:RNA repair domain-containing protein [Nanoarchaeota archaeon]